MEVVGVTFTDPTGKDLIVKYSYTSGWDLTKYLQSFGFQFIDAKSGKVILVTSFKSKGLWKGVRDGRLESAFNEIRSKAGYPPTRQFEK